MRDLAKLAWLMLNGKLAAMGFMPRGDYDVAVVSNLVRMSESPFVALERREWDAN